MKTLKSLLEEFEDELSEKDQHHLKNLHGLLTNHYKKESYSGLAKKGLDHYTTGSSVNATLWNHHLKKSEYNPTKHWSVTNLDEAINTIKTPKTFHVYSNTLIDPRRHINSEGVVHHPAYMSTSINKKFPEHWVNREDVGGERHRHIFKIKVPKGHSGVYVGDHISKVPGQHEFILPRGLNLKYHKTIKKEGHLSMFEQRRGLTKAINHFHEMEIV